MVYSNHEWCYTWKICGHIYIDKYTCMYLHNWSEKQTKWKESDARHEIGCGDSIQFGHWQYIHIWDTQRRVAVLVCSSVTVIANVINVFVACVRIALVESVFHIFSRSSHPLVAQWCVCVYDTHTHLLYQMVNSNLAVEQTAYTHFQSILKPIGGVWNKVNFNFVSHSILIARDMKFILLLRFNNWFLLHFLKGKLYT